MTEIKIKYVFLKIHILFMFMKPKFTGTKKKCLKCDHSFPMSEFYLAKKTGIYTSYCKKCYSDIRRKSLSLSYKNRANSLFNSAKHGSKKNGTVFKITKNDIIHQYEQQNGKCYYSGNPLSLVSGDDNVMSIDRINPNLGYTIDNIVICGWKINKMKSNFSLDKFLKLCKEICDFSTTRPTSFHPKN
jgi:hypothetical protein